MTRLTSTHGLVRRWLLIGISSYPLMTRLTSTHGLVRRWLLIGISSYPLMTRLTSAHGLVRRGRSLLLLTLFPYPLITRLASTAVQFVSGLGDVVGQYSAAGGAITWDVYPYLEWPLPTAYGWQNKIYAALIRGHHLTDVRITGGGVIDGGGKFWCAASSTAMQKLRIVILRFGTS
jgi:hypothetical protein